MNAFALAFNPAPRVERVALDEGRECWVIDDALREPERVVEWATAQRDAFRRVDYNAYPGVLLPMPAADSAALNDFFVAHLRRRFDARRVVHMHSRLALVTLAPEQLGPRQCLCHRDSVGLDAAQSIQASVLYLFHDDAFGGTSFYLPTRSEREIAQLFHDASTLPREEFLRRYDVEANYMADSNAWFRRIGRVAPKWNRLVFYDGAMLHSGDIPQPQRLSDDPARGRLTLNGFFTCRRNAAR